MLFIDTDTTGSKPNYMSVAFATNHTFSISAETTDVSSKDHGIYGAQEISKITWELTTENLTSTAEENGYNTLYNYMLEQRVIPVMFALVDSAATDEIIGQTPQSWSIGTEIIQQGDFNPHNLHRSNVIGEGIITSLTLNANNGETSTFSATITGTSTLQIITAPRNYNFNMFVNANVIPPVCLYKSGGNYTVADINNKNYYVGFSNMSPVTSKWCDTFTNFNPGDYSQMRICNEAGNYINLVRRGPDPTTTLNYGSKWGDCYSYYFSKSDWSGFEWDDFQSNNYTYVLMQQNVDNPPTIYIGGSTAGSGTPHPVVGIYYAYGQNTTGDYSTATPQTTFDTNYVQYATRGSAIKLPLINPSNPSGQRYVVYLQKDSAGWYYTVWCQWFFSNANIRYAL